MVANIIQSPTPSPASSDILNNIIQVICRFNGSILCYTIFITMPIMCSLYKIVSSIRFYQICQKQKYAIIFRY